MKIGFKRPEETKFLCKKVYNEGKILGAETKMGQVVYADLFFLINFSMDFLCFYLTARILSRKLHLFRGVLAAVLGGIYANAALFLTLGRIPSLFLDFLVCVLMCAVVFGGRREWRSLPLYSVVYTAVSMTLGGFMTALFHLLNGSRLSDIGEAPKEDGLSVWMFALLAVISALLTLIGGRFFSRKSTRKVASVTVAQGGKKLRLRALCDSGNLLREPISGKPCIVVDTDAVKEILPPDVWRAAKKKNAEDFETISPGQIGRVRLVPTKTAAGDGLLLAFRPDEIILECGKERHRVDAMMVLGEIGKTADGNQALVPAELLV